MTNSMRLLAMLLGPLLLSCTEAHRPESSAAAAGVGAERTEIGAESRAAASKELAAWRDRIDGADRELVALLNRRAEYVLKLAPLKRQIGVEVRDPGREQQVLRNLSEANHGPLPDESLRKIYGSIMAAMRDLQSPD
jgi:chorismate mutase